MTRENALLINTIREVLGKSPIPCKGQVKGNRAPYEFDRQRFIANLARFEGDGNRRVPTKGPHL